MKQIIILVFSIFFLGTFLQAQVVMNDTYVVLVDWQGHLMDPMAKLKLVSPTEGRNFPLEVKIKAIETSCLMLDLQRAILGNV